MRWSWGFSSTSLYLFLWISILLASSTEGGEFEDQRQYRYKFIKPASKFWDQRDDVAGEESGFDYIIVGGGTAGCPLAATLSQNYTVLLLERGGTPFHNTNITLMENFHIALADISDTSPSQMFISTDGVFNSRARVLGGGTCINAGFYTRANPSFIRKSGWDDELVKESFEWVEKQIVHKPKVNQWQNAVRDGLLEVGISPYNGFTYDHKYGTKVGGTIYDKNGRRHSAAELLASGNPDKLTVLVYATVQKIDFDTTNEPGGRPKAVGVTFKDENGVIHRAALRKRPESEVILSAGAIGSPHLLLLSGIGPASELERFNISPVLENEFMGKNMTDNPLNTIFVPLNGSVEQSLITTVGITRRGVYIEASSGYGQSAKSIHCNHGIASAEIGQLSTIPPKLRNHEAIHRYRQAKRNLPHEAFMGGFILEKIARPKSKGQIALNNTNIDDNPTITFNYFSHPDDLERCVSGIRIVKKLLKSHSVRGFTQLNKQSVEMLMNMSVSANINLIPRHKNDAKSLKQFCRDTVITIWHYHGGCHVGKVVDKEYKVLGVDRLRVVDGAVFFESPGTNPQATVMMMGRYMGLQIMKRRAS